MHQSVWRPENSVNIWNLLWLYRPVIICTEQIGIYLGTFPNALTSKKSKSWDKYIFFNKFARRLVSRTVINQKFNTFLCPNEARYWALKLQTDVNLPPPMPDEDKNFRCSLVLDFRKWWRHVKTIYINSPATQKHKQFTILEIWLSTLSFLVVYFTKGWITLATESEAESESEAQEALRSSVNQKLESETESEARRNRSQKDQKSFFFFRFRFRFRRFL